jgi:hypothetical protein
MSRNRFRDPATGDTYDWKVNHSEEDEQGKTRNITHSANTGLTGLVRQQGDDGPMVLKYTGVILDRSQYIEFWRWYDLCRTQTIYFYDPEGQGYEVQITVFTPQRVRNLSRPFRDPANYHWRYRIEMEVYRFLSGDLRTAGVTP